MAYLGKTNMAAAAETESDWGELHEDLLVLILKKIELIKDFVAFGMVCKTWNETARKNKQCLRPQIPWLILVDDVLAKYGLRPIHDVSMNKIRTRKRMLIDFPSDRMCIGLNYGWALTMSRPSGDMNLVHPLSGSEIKLPNQKSIDYNENHLEWLWNNCFPKRAAISGNPSESPSDFTIMIANSGGCFLRYWRPGDTCWTTSKFDPEGIICDLIYYKDQFYAISYRGILWACVIHHDQHDIVPRKVIEIDREKIFVPRVSAYIVESKSPDVLLLVVRKDKSVYHSYNNQKHGEIDEEGDKLFDVDYIKYGSTGFTVYELDLMKGSCSNKITNMGDKAIFLGLNTTQSFDTSHFNGIMPNHIYFTDDCVKLPMQVKGGGNMGCYGLEDAKITRFNAGSSRSRISPPFWFIPAW